MMFTLLDAVPHTIFVNLEYSERTNIKRKIFLHFFFFTMYNNWMRRMILYMSWYKNDPLKFFPYQILYSLAMGNWKHFQKYWILYLQYTLNLSLCSAQELLWDLEGGARPASIIGTSTVGTAMFSLWIIIQSFQHWQNGKEIETNIYVSVLRA